MSVCVCLSGGRGVTMSVNGGDVERDSVFALCRPRRHIVVHGV